MKKIDYILLLIAVIAVLLLGIGAYNNQPVKDPGLKANVTQSVFYGGTGTTNSSTTVNTTSTQVLPNTWSAYARISTRSTSTFSCFIDGATGASSSVANGSGLIFGSVATSTLAGNQSVCFGNFEGCVPYIGPVNCTANVQAAVGIIYH